MRVAEHRRSREELGTKIQGKLEGLLSLRIDVISIYVGPPSSFRGIRFDLFHSRKNFSSNPEGFINSYSFLISMLLVISGFQLVAFGLLANLIYMIRRVLSQNRCRD